MSAASVKEFELKSKTRWFKPINAGNGAHFAVIAIIRFTIVTTVWAATASRDGEQGRCERDVSRIGVYLTG